MKRIHAIALAAAIAGCGKEANQSLQGYAEGEYLRVASPIAGQLARLHVARGTAVKAGEPLFALEQENERVPSHRKHVRLHETSPPTADPWRNPHPQAARPHGSVETLNRSGLSGGGDACLDPR